MKLIYLCNTIFIIAVAFTCNKSCTLASKSKRVTQGGTLFVTHRHTYAFDSKTTFFHRVDLPHNNIYASAILNQGVLYSCPTGLYLETSTTFKLSKDPYIYSIVTNEDNTEAAWLDSTSSGNTRNLNVYTNDKVKRIQIPVDFVKLINFSRDTIIIQNSSSPMKSYCEIPVNGGSFEYKSFNPQSFYFGAGKSVELASNSRTVFQIEWDGVKKSDSVPGNIMAIRILNGRWLAVIFNDSNIFNIAIGVKLYDANNRCNYLGIVRKSYKDSPYSLVGILSYSAYSELLNATR